MKLFLDTADVDDIRRAQQWGVLAGVTTNPTLFSKVGHGTYDALLARVCDITNGPVSAEVVAENASEMVAEGRAFAKIAPNIVVKIPMSESGLEAIAQLRSEGIPTNCTLVFSANQGLLAARAGATLISPFVGRLDDINQDGMAVVRELSQIIRSHGIGAEVLAASIRTPRQATDAALAGSHIATVPFNVLRHMVHHPLTESGITQFRADWDRASLAPAEAATR